MIQDALPDARAAHAAGRLDAAEALYRAAGPHDPEAALGLAAILMQTCRVAEALAMLEPWRAARPGSAEIRATLAAALQAAGRTDEAVLAYEDALALAPGHVEAHYGLAAALHLLGRLDEAAAGYRRTLIGDPDYAEAACGLGIACRSLGHVEQAIAAFERALDVDPEYAEARVGLAGALAAAERHAEAEAAYRCIVGGDPAHAVAASCALAAMLVAAGRHDAALDVLDAALDAGLADAPGEAALHRQRGLTLAEQGALDQAAGALETALAIAPTAALYRELANCRRLAPADPHLRAMQAMAARADALPGSEQVHLCFALGRALTDAGDPAAGFRHLLAGNALHRKAIRYDEAQTLRLFERIEAAFSPNVLRERAGAGETGAAPIFIVGMPRSGSTLIEQMLACHPDIDAGGERTAFGRAVRAAGMDTDDMPFPESVEYLDGTALRALGADYLARIGSGGAARPTDKMLANAVFAGLIHLALPDARIVNARRDPVDTCLSCFAELFASDVPFAYDLGELGRFHRAQAGLLDHWRRVIPSHAILDVDYEAMVRDPESEARRLLEFCGLAWNPAVLRFHESRRPVRTASLAQVRRPLYTSSVGRWRPDADLLRPLLDGLAEGLAGGLAGSG